LGNAGQEKVFKFGVEWIVRFQWKTGLISETMRDRAKITTLLGSCILPFKRHENH